MTSPSSDALQTALAQVIDPELRRNVVELGMVDAVDVDGEHVHVTIRLTIPGCPLKSNLEAQVRMHVGAVPGVGDVTVGFTHMDEAQRAALREQLHGGRSEGERQIAVEERTRVIAVASGKGGVGKSSLTVNLALALRARGLEVGIVDADIYGYSIPGMLGIQQRPVVVDKMIVPPVAHDLKVMSIGFFLDDGGSVVWRGPMLHRALEQFLSDVYWGPLDYLLIDMPPGTGDVGLSLGQLLPRSEAVLVTTPQLAAQRVAVASGADGREARAAAPGRDREHVEPGLPLLRRGDVPLRPGRWRGAGGATRRAAARRGAARGGAARGQRQRRADLQQRSRGTVGTGHRGHRAAHRGHRPGPGGARSHRLSARGRQRLTPPRGGLLPPILRADSSQWGTRGHRGLDLVWKSMC